MAKRDKVGVHGTDAETGRDKAKAKDGQAATGTKCPITREQFATKAPSHVRVRFGNLGEGQEGQAVDLIAMRKEFESGSLGYYLGDKITLMVDGVPVKVQVGLNMTVVGSKELPR